VSTHAAHAAPPRWRRPGPGAFALLVVALAIVAHGTVISLFVAAHNQINSFELWQQLAMPSFVVLGLPSFALVEAVTSAD
jgi:hypothetical protein